MNIYEALQLHSHQVPPELCHICPPKIHDVEAETPSPMSLEKARRALPAPGRLTDKTLGWETVVSKGFVFNT